MAEDTVRAADTAISVAPISQGFTQEQIDIIKSQVAPKGTTNDELAMFLQYCQRTGLDPFARQIYLSERRSKNQQTGQWDVKRVPETTIDGFRVTAERSRQYAGQLGPFWCGEDGEWKDVWISQKPPLAARVGILRHDFKEPLWAVALYDEYVQTKADGNPNSMWAKMPANQLAKCAESLGHRKAFPRELSGLYTKEEMPSEQQEGKAAQVAYLAEKGLAPYEAPKKLPPASTVASATIRELADMLDPVYPEASDYVKPDHGIRAIEMRQAKQVAEADAQLKEVAKKPPRKRGGITFDVLKYFGEIKTLLRETTGDDGLYYQTLKAYGYEHADAITDNDQAREIYRALGQLHKRATEDNRLRTELELAEATYGSARVKAIYGANGCTCIDDVLCLASEPLEVLRSEIKALGQSQ